MENEKIVMKLQEVSDKADRNEGRIKKLEHESEAIHKLATSVAVMVEQMKSIDQKVTKLDGEFEEIKSKPAKRWESIVEKIIMTVLAAVIGFVLAKLGIV